MREQAAPILSCDLCKKSPVDALATVYSSNGLADVPPHEFVGNLKILAELCPDCWDKLTEFLRGGGWRE